jgi:predicted XRE-type DNA-binding protein
MIFVMTPILDDIRKAIDASDKKQAQISRETGISQSRLCQLMAGTKGMSVEALELLADCLGLKIVTEPKRRTKGK